MCSFLMLLSMTSGDVDVTSRLSPAKSHATHISYLEFWQPFCSAEQNHLCNFGRGYQEEQFYVIILNLNQWFRRCHLKDFLSGALEALVFGGAEPFMRFWYRALWGPSCEVILNLDQWFRRCCLKKN